MSYLNQEDIKATIRKHKICVLIPTYNNAGTLRVVISETLKYALNVIVVNDGSSDSTNAILGSFGEAIICVNHEKNRGKGAALKSGFLKAKELGFEYAITLDSDGQHYPSNIPDFVAAIIENKGALIVGERNLTCVDINGKSSFANKFSNFWFNLQTGCKLKDTQTGYRAYPLNKLYGLGLLTSRYEAELELMVYAFWNGVEIKSIPIDVYYPPRAERVSHFRPGIDFTRISILNTFLCGAAIIYGIPSRLFNAIRHKAIFTKDFKPFTHKKGERKDAATTLGRLNRSFYGLAYFVFWSIGIFTPLSLLFFSIGNNTEAKKLKFHKMLQWISKFLTKRFPGCETAYEKIGGETLDNPALVICNHQSHLDLPVLMSLHPKLIFLTNDWVWNNFFYGKIIHNAEFLPVSAGMDVILPQLRDLKRRGFSIVVFPEGTRSPECNILRFHQGAFHLAKELDMDIVPLMLHGAGHYLPKKDFMFRKGKITLRILPRVKREEVYEMTPMEQASHFRKLIRKEYDKIVCQNETSDYFKSLILYKYAYRGWRVVARCKKTLKQIRRYQYLIDNNSAYSRVRILNSGIGTFALTYALVNKNTEVYAYESNLQDSTIAETTVHLPKNLHYIHSVWESETGTDEEYDLTISLHSLESAAQDNYISIPLKS